MSLDEFDNIDWPRPRLPSAATSDGIRRLCTTDLAATKPVEAKRRLRGSIVVSLAVLLVLLVVGFLRHPPQQSFSELLLVFGGWSLAQIAVLGVCHARPPGRRCPRGLRWSVGITVLASFLIYLTLTATSHLTWGEFLAKPHSLRGSIACGVHALLFGALATVALLALWRKTDPYSPRLTGALSGLAGGLVGAIALDLVCVSREAWHLWFGHGLALIVLMALGWRLGKRWLSP